MTVYSFRIADIEDVDAIVALVESAYRGETSRVGWTTEADLLDGQRTDSDEVARLMTHPSSCILLCEDDNKIIASVHLLNKREYTYLGMFAVRPDQQANGIGSLLLAEAEKYAFTVWHCSSVRIAVIFLREDLIAWYERRGYRTNGEFMPFPYGDERYGIPKRDDLVLSVLEKQLIE